MTSLGTLYDILIGVCLSVGIWHLMTGLLKKDRIINFLLLGISILLMIYLVIQKSSYHTHDLEAIAIYSKLMMFVVPLLGIFMAWFVFHYTQDKSYWGVTAISVTYIAVMIVNIVLPYSILYKEIIGIKTIQLPWGESASMPDAIIGPWHFLTDFALLILITYLIFASYRLYKTNRKPVALAWIVLISLIIASALFDYMIVNDFVESLYMIPYAFTLFIVAACLILINSVIKDSRITDDIIEKEQKWERLFDNVNLVVVGLNRMGNVDYINPFFLELTGYEADEVIGKDWFANFLPGTYSYDVQGTFLEILKNNFHPYYENPILTSEGKELSIAWYNVRIVNREGKITGSLSIGCDVTKFCQDHEVK